MNLSLLESGVDFTSGIPDKRTLPQRLPEAAAYSENSRRVDPAAFGQRVIPSVAF